MVDALNLNDHFSFHTKIEMAAAAESKAAIDYGYWFLLLYKQPALREFKGGADLVGRLRKPRPKRFVYLGGSVYDCLR